MKTLSKSEINARAYRDIEHGPVTATPEVHAVAPLPCALPDGPSPGPWEADWNKREDRWQLRGPRGTFGHFCGWSVDGITTEAEDEANAALIASAPRLAAENAKLRACLEHILKDPYTTCSCAEIARAALGEGL